jgi:hypothetical protein
MLRVRFLPAVLLAVPMAGLTAQSTYGILTGLEGKKVRLSVTVGAGDGVEGFVDIRGKVFEVRGDSVHVLQDGGGVTRIPFSSVHGLDVSLGKSHLLGAGFGALWGAGFGLVISMVPMDCDDQGRGLDCNADGSKPSVADYVESNVGAGVFVGTIIGAVIGKERWQHVLTRPKVSVAPARGGGIRLGMSF